MSLIDLRPHTDYMQLERIEVDSKQLYPPIMEDLVAATKSRKDLVIALDRTVRALGFDTFMYGFATVPRPRSESKMWTFSTLPIGWVRAYEANAYIEVDPRVQLLFQSPLPVIWDQTERGKSPRVDAFLDHASEYNIRSGTSLYLPDGGEFNYMVCFNSSRRLVDAAQRNLWLRQQGELMMFGVYFHALFMKPLISKGLAPSSQGTPLSVRELETLNWVVKGLTHEEIACRMGITSRTVQAHADSIRSKMNASTISEAVFLATKAGLLARPSAASGAASY